MAVGVTGTSTCEAFTGTKFERAVPQVAIDTTRCVMSISLEIQAANTVVAEIDKPLQVMCPKINLMLMERVLEMLRFRLPLIRRYCNRSQHK